MYEENLEPLPPGDAAQIFAPVLADIQRHCELEKPRAVTHDQVLFWANTDLQKYLTRISRRLLLPGSRVLGIQNLKDLVDLADQGAGCILCLNHRSNLDVPTLAAMLHDQSKLDLFNKIIWVAGRKLHEDQGMTGMLLQGFNRVVVTPRSWADQEHSEEEIEEANLINIAAHRTIHDLRHEGWVFAVFPTGTRARPDDPSTKRAIPETDGYLKSFDQMLLGNIAGCTLPVTRDQDLTRETPRLDRVRYRFGEVTSTEAWRAKAATRFADLDQRTASAHAIMQDIASLASRFDE